MDKTTTLAGEISGVPAIDGIGNWCHGARHAPTRVEKGGNNKALTHSLTHSPPASGQNPPASSAEILTF